MLGLSLLKSANGVKTIIISANANDVNLFGLAGNPAVRGKYRFVINPDVVIGHTTSIGALTVGQFPTGSEIQIDNYGQILGRGGKGGVYPSGGSAGGDAIRANYTGQKVTINNYGQIKAGGGGGGSGGYGGAGGVGAWGNIRTTTQWYWFWDNNNGSEWDVHDNGIVTLAWTNDPGRAGGDSTDTVNFSMLSDTMMLWAQGIWERGDARGHYTDPNPYGPYESYNIRMHFLFPPGAARAAVVGGNGGDGAGYGTTRSDGSMGGASQPGDPGSNGSGNGGANGQGGWGGNGGDWASAGTGGGSGSYGGNGGAGAYVALPVGISNGQPGGGGYGGGAPGTAIVVGSATVTVNNTGTIVGNTL